METSLCVSDVAPSNIRKAVEPRSYVYAQALTPFARTEAALQLIKTTVLITQI